MCGITGFVSPQPAPVQPLVAMNRLLRHRGPDDEGYLLAGADGRLHALAGPDTPPECASAELPWRTQGEISRLEQASTRLALGHRRLSIVDLSAAGHQPLCTPDRRHWIVYNGEIYNHVELRRELQALGRRFLSHSDTEVVLAAWQQWGSDCLQRFKGMWAFAIADSQTGELFLARDRFGIKPLYYWVSPAGVFCFASEIKAFTAMPGWSAAVNPQRAYDFLVWSMLDHTEETLFKGVFQLRPGHALTLAANSVLEPGQPVAASQWYRVRPGSFDGSFDDAAQVFRERFTRSVQEHLRADVAVGSCLSGGLDSSSIVCVVNRLLAEQGRGALQKSFSACTGEKRSDERHWIEMVRGETGVDAHFVYPSLDELFEQTRDITWHQDEPFGSTSIYAQWCVFRLAAAARVKVMLDGQGADEMLAGYHNFFGPRFANLLRRGQLLQLLHEMRQTRALHGHSVLHMAMWTADMFLPEALRHKLRALAGRAFADPPWLNLHALGAQPVDPRCRMGPARCVQSMSLNQLTASNLQMLLHWEDRDSMAHSVESRVPFLDHELVEFVLSLPDEYKLQAGMTKRVQRAGMQGILPRGIRERVDKIGFQTPEESWLRGPASATFLARLEHAVDASRGVLNDSCITMLRDMIAGRRPFSYTIWRLISFGDWMDGFAVRPARG